MHKGGLLTRGTTLIRAIIKIART